VTTERTRDPGPGIRDGLTVNLVGVALLLAVGVLVAAAGGALGLVLAGRPQALGAVLGAGMTTGFYLLGTVTVSLVAAYAPRASLLVALLTYVLQVAALALVLAKVQAAQERPGSGTTVDVAWVGGTVVVATVVWLVLLALRSVPPVSDPGVGR
jgi:ATP synthase protein I